MIKKYFHAISEKYIFDQGKALSKSNIRGIKEISELEGVISFYGEVKNEYRYEDVEIFINKEDEYRSTFSCSCPYNGLCSHVVGLILRYKEKNKNREPKFQKYEYRVKNNEVKVRYESKISNWILGYIEYDSEIQNLLSEIPFLERELIYTFVIQKSYELNTEIINILKKLYIEDKNFKIKDSSYKVDIKKGKISVKDISNRRDEIYFIKNEELVKENNKDLYPEFLFEKLSEYLTNKNVTLGNEIQKYMLYKKEMEYILKFKKLNSEYIIIPIIKTEEKVYKNRSILNIDRDYKQIDKYTWERIDMDEYNEFITFLRSENIEFRGSNFYCKDMFFKKEYLKINKDWTKKGITNIRIKGDIDYSISDKKSYLNINYKLKNSNLNEKELEDISKKGILEKNGKMYLVKNTDEIIMEKVKTNNKEEIFCKLEKLKRNRNLNPQEDIFKGIKIENEKLDNILRPYQKRGVKWMKFLKKFNFSGILADDMGLGKTLQVLTLISELYDDNLILIIVPKSLIYNWEDEINKFLDTENYIIYDGSPDKRRDLQKRVNDNGILITSYGMVRQDIDYLKSLKLKYVILDEAQIIKNNDTIAWKAVSSLDSEHRLALTGTPLENHYKEVWSIFEFLMPGYLGNIDKYQDEEEYLKYKIAPFIMRRVKGEVLKDLPDKNEKVLKLELLPEQRKVYDEILDKMKRKINRAMGSKKGNIYFTILGALTYLREVCDSPKLIGKNIDSSIKIEMFEELIIDAIENNHKILVFSQFVKMLNILEKVAKRNNIKYEKLTGKTKNRFEKVKRFNKTKDIKIFFISLKAGGTGLNLTSADTIMHIDPWWNPMVESQATDRAHRIGQKQKVNVYKFITKNTIEEKILDIQKRKKEIFEDIIEDNKKELEKISIDELVDLFN